MTEQLLLFEPAATPAPPCQGALPFLRLCERALYRR